MSATQEKPKENKSKPRSFDVLESEEFKPTPGGTPPKFPALPKKSPPNPPPKEKK